jgi:putative oxygen-independent coproporphyrinogen III oxidase
VPGGTAADEQLDVPSAAPSDATDDGAGAPRPFGVYLHIPFCAARCDYCDFATWTDRTHLAEAYADACVTDLRRRYEPAGADAPPPATTVFVGGGTPSLLPAATLVRILDAIPRVPGAEVTVECNPESVDLAKLTAYRAAGVTRLSFGVQSLVDRVLAALGRLHRRGDVEAAVAAARAAGFETFNLDLIYGGHGETADDWAATLDRALELDPPHVSAYALTVEPGTPLAGRITAGELAAPDDDVLADRYDVADERLGASGRPWYEISNWARPGHECRHNGLYWDQGDYLGIGCAAHGHTGGRRWWTVRTPERYVDRVARGVSPEGGAERLDPDRRAEERLALALRTRGGVVLARGRAVDAEVAALAEEGLLTSVDAPGGHRVVLTRTGRRLGGELTARFMALGARPAALALGMLECQPAGPGPARPRGDG